MPSFDLLNQPQYPVVVFDSDSELNCNQLVALMGSAKGITLCVRSASGHNNRGGYFFCIEKANNEYQLQTMEGIFVDQFDLQMLVRFINHASGRKFDSNLLDYCQNSINFRND